ncbi:MAG: 2OG-Fe(II) oxygenase family protein [Gemmataceae bacterium]|nr:2OG-Fe(II) oxygenase family protein [Gemmataceae bacterium]
MRVSEFALFPTRLLSIQFDGVEAMNAGLAALFAGEAFAGGFDMHPDSFNLLDKAGEWPVVREAAALFRQGLEQWLAREGLKPAGADAVLFTSLSERGDFTVVHNHNADVVAVYYAQCGTPAKPAVLVPGEDDEYFAAEDGALLLHDPRFNANLAASGSRDYAKVFPRPGLMVVFPGWLWHSVTPHLGERPRLALSANFRLKWAEKDNAVAWPLA